MSIFRLFQDEQNVLSVFTDFCVIFTFSKNIFTSKTKSALFNIFIQLGLSFLFLFDKISLDFFFFVSLTLLFISVINHIQQINFYNTRNKYLFTNEIVNNSNNLTIATNRKGEVIFCSKNIESILGFNADEVLGFGFWRLTEDPEFKGESYHDQYVDNRTYTRKLKNKNGDYVLIEWQDKMYNENLFVGIGTDITYQNKIENQYKELVEKATDSIYEIDLKGHFTFVNNYFLELMEYTLEDLRTLHYLDIIADEYKEKVKYFYVNEKPIRNEYPILEFSAKTKSGKILWASQKVTIKRDLKNKVTGYSAISRNITALKLLESQQKFTELKSERFNKSLLKCAKFHSETGLDSKKFIDEIIEEASKALEIDRVSYWEFGENKILCKNLFENGTLVQSDDKFIAYGEMSKYFDSLTNKGIFIVNDIITSNVADEFMSYSNETSVKSFVDMCIKINNKNYGILCFESTKKHKKWDNLDIGFVRSVAEITTTLIESQKRIETEKILKYKTEILSAMTKNTNKILKEKNTKDIFDTVIGSIGPVINVNRIYYYEVNKMNQSISLKFNWESYANQNNLESQSEFSTFNLNLFEDILPYLYKNKQFNGLVKNLNDSLLKDILVFREVKSIMFVGVIIKNELYGFVGFSDCDHERIWTDDESTILQTLVDNFAAALERNINEQIILESEERFRLLANNIPGAVYLSKNDAKWSKIYVNEKIEELTGYPKEDFLENKIYFVDLVFREDLKVIVETQKESLNSKKSFNIKYRIRHKNGKVIWIEEYGDAVYKNGEVVYIEGVFMDITDKISQENAMKEKELAEAANQSKSIFLANMSHEIRTPLNGIIGFTNLLKETKLENDQKEYIKTIYYSSQMLLVIVNDILDFSKIESGKYKIVLEPFNIRENCTKVIEAVRYDVIKKGLKIHLFIDDDLPENVMTDTIRIKQILINLLSNAVKFTTVGDVTLSITKKRYKSKDQTRVRFSVSDTGIGIKKENLSKIFEAFSQADNSTTRQFGGTGLGLNISNKILDLFGSKIKLKSVFGVGSVFYFDLVLDNVSNTLINRESQNFKNIFDKKNYSIEFKTNDWKVLLVEDNTINMLLIKTMIKKLLPKAIIFEAKDGLEGVVSFSNHEPDLILMDVQMPNLNGYEATKKIREIEKEKNYRTPIVALTAGIVSDERNKWFEAGMDDFLSKPIVKETLEFTIYRCLNIKK
jgi:PAS domain S-box-containing protein